MAGATRALGDHAWLLLALAGVAAARRRPVLALLATPYLRGKLRRRGARGATVELPGHVAVELAEIVTMLPGSIRHRTLLI